MKNAYLLLLCVWAFPVWGQETLKVRGVQDSVEILVDQWGVPHIYAKSEKDLFFAQGFYAARDRLFQFEIWRRQATGTVAEILGPRELKRDLGARLFQFRGDIQDDMRHYHPRGDLIITSFVAGVNAYIEETERNPNLLPLEFKLLGIKPGKWTPEVVVSRHQGLLGNIGDELDLGRAVALLGPERVKELSWFHPGNPNLDLDPLVSKALLEKDILELYNAFRRPLPFRPEDLIAGVRQTPEAYEQIAVAEQKQWEADQRMGKEIIGSNNWIVSGGLTQSGYPVLANDPHRALSAPSLRYMAHLVAPGWNVIGGGEPVIPGISIGHNEFGAWGLTIFSTDAEDLCVYETHPDQPDWYQYRGNWEPMSVLLDTIRVKGQPPVVVELKYTRHGPVVFQDSSLNRACAVRCGWLAPGGAPYLASLRMNQASSWDEFRLACQYSHIPGENMIWADRQGNIGWQAVGITPIRRHFSGLVPVPGDGRFEWDGFLPVMERPHVLNPKEGYLATANENVTPVNYPYPEAIGFAWSDPYRGDRVSEFLASGRKHSLLDMVALQTDYLSLPARQLTILLRNLHSADPLTEQAIGLLTNWDCRLDKHSAAAGIYNAWERQLRANLTARLIPKEVSGYLSFQMKQVVDFLTLPSGHFGPDALKGRDDFLLQSLSEAVKDLEKRFGKDIRTWQYGQPGYKHVLIRHPLSNALNETMKKKFELGPLPRGGNGSTVNNTGNGDNQTHGPTFRLIADTGNWDHCLATNAPGQSGNPDHPHYRNLFEMWAKDRYFPLFYSAEKIKSVTYSKLVLQPFE
ncbi:MAG: penicillin acylase family protein [Haliscomenobacter sp.]|nr:penicillin acylase family protein [Haliscomenobacter sp.]